MVVLVEGQIDSSVSRGLLMAFGAVTAAVVGLMLMAMLNCSFILLHVLNFPAKQSVIAIANGEDADTFSFFWRTRCQDDWEAAYKSFRLGALCEADETGDVGSCDAPLRLRHFTCFEQPCAGVSLFVVSLALLGWVKFHDFPIAAGLVTAVAVCCILYWLLHTKVCV